MSVDLDDLFDAMGRQADTMPLGGADRARERGRHRSRVRAVVSVAAAVLLIAVGAGLTLQQRGEQALPADKTIQGTPLPEVSPPIDLGGPADFSVMGTDGKRAYTAWVRTSDKSLRLTAHYLDDAEGSWGPMAIVDPQRNVSQVVAVLGAVVVITEARNEDVTPAFGLHAFDPSSGQPLWTKTAARADSLVFTEAAFVQVTAAGGRVDSFDWVSGLPLWSRTTGDPVVRAVGMGTAADEAGYSQSGPSSTFSDSRVLLLTDGFAEERDAATGETKQSVPVAAVSGDTVAAYDGWLFTHDEADSSPGPQHIRATDLDTGTTRVVAELPGGFLALNACGKDRVCVLTQTQPANAAPVTKLTSIDVRKAKVLWQRDSTYGGGAISSAGGATVVVTETGGAPEVFDASGKLRYRAPLSGQWLDGKSLLVAMPDGTGRLARLSVGTYKLTPYAKLLTDFGIRSCTSNSTRLACFREDTGNLQVWKLG